MPQSAKPKLISIKNIFVNQVRSQRYLCVVAFSLYMRWSLLVKPCNHQLLAFSVFKVFIFVSLSALFHFVFFSALQLYSTLFYFRPLNLFYRAFYFMRAFSFILRFAFCALSSSCGTHLLIATLAASEEILGAHCLRVYKSKQRCDSECHH